MYQPVKIAPSILSADFLHLAKEIQMIEQAGAGYIHMDIMDGHFVPNITMGVPVLEQLVRLTDLPVDVHLMVSNPLDQISWFVQAGAYTISVHAEALKNDELVQAVKMIRDGGCCVSVALKPKTSVSVLSSIISDVDMVLIMSVEPGFSGQSFIEGTEEKVSAIVDMAHDANASPLIEVDGGVDLMTAPLVASLGADVLVCGNAIFCAENPSSVLSTIEVVANDARLASMQQSHGI